MKGLKKDWRRDALGGWITLDGRWRIRGPIFGKPMFWLYRDGVRYLAAPGNYDSAVSFPTRAKAQHFADERRP